MKRRTYKKKQRKHADRIYKMSRRARDRHDRIERNQREDAAMGVDRTISFEP